VFLVLFWVFFGIFEAIFGVFFDVVKEGARAQAHGTVVQV
jgi:hypothetical protein